MRNNFGGEEKRDSNSGRYAIILTEVYQPLSYSQALQQYQTLMANGISATILNEINPHISRTITLGMDQYRFINDELFIRVDGKLNDSEWLPVSSFANHLKALIDCGMFETARALLGLWNEVRG